MRERMCSMPGACDELVLELGHLDEYEARGSALEVFAVALRQ